MRNPMRNTFTLILASAAMAMLGGPLRAQELPQIAGAGAEADRAAVLATLRTYLRVTDDLDQAAVAAAFHPEAHLVALTKAGSVGSMTQEVWWERVSQIPPGAAKRQSAVKYIDVEGNAAIARIDFTTPTTRTTDYLSLLKTRAGWRIVNKILATPIG